MIELLKQQFRVGMSGEDKINRVREFLQLTTLKIIYDKGYFHNLAFVGGTALRALFNLKRFSEDLDFSVINKKKYNFMQIVSDVEREFKLYGLNIEVKTKQDKTVQNSFLKFGSLLKNLGLSNLEEQKLSIKLEVDLNPPKGWNIENTLVSNVYMINIVHYDLSSLYATKLHACFFRKYTKGRDFYDLFWYMGKRIKPNLELLNNAIKQTEGYEPHLTEDNLNEFMLAKLRKIDFEKVRNDAERFLEDKGELKLLQFEVIKNTLTIKPQ
jgi:predicted nucleotidyltransferase component of viral defense system